jgi:hypothetical protein
MRNNYLFGVLLTVGFILLDVLGLGLLPVLKISFGGFWGAFIALVFVRASFLIVWWLLTRWTLLVKFGALNRATPWSLVGLNLAFLALVFYGFYIEPMRLTVSQLEVEVSGLQQPVRIVQLSDIHVEYTTRRDEALPELVESLHPDMIVMTGDYLNEDYLLDPITHEDFRNLISQLHAPLGIFAVTATWIQKR